VGCKPPLICRIESTAGWQPVVRRIRIANKIMDGEDVLRCEDLFNFHL
jgi:hypothetical protein